MRRLLAILAIALAAPAAGQSVRKNGLGSVVINGQSSWRGLTVSPASDVTVGRGASAPLCTVSGASVVASGTLYGQTSTLTKVSHGCVLYQGDVVVVTAATHPENVGAYEAIGSDATTVMVLGAMATDTVSFTAYRGVTATRSLGGLTSMATVDGTYDHDGYAFSMKYEATSGRNRGGFFIDFGNNNSSDHAAGFGDGEFYQYPFGVYRNRYQGWYLYTLNALGSTFQTGDLRVDGTGSFGAIATTALACGAAPTVTPATPAGTRWDYSYVITLLDGSHTPECPVGTTSTGGANLATNANTVGWPGIQGAYFIDVYRKYAGGTPSSLGKIYHGLQNYDNHTANGGGYVDSGAVGDTTSPPTTNTTGTVTAAAANVTGTVTAAAISTPSLSNATKVALDQNGVTYLGVTNASTGGAAKAQIAVGQIISGGNYGIFEHYGTNYATNGPHVANRTGLFGVDTAGLAIGSAAAAPLVFATYETERGSIAATGEWTMLTAITAPSISCSPTISTGMIAPTTTPAKVGDIFVDTVLHKLYFSDCTTSSACWVIAN